MGLQSLVALAFPPRCLSCGGLVGEDFALCAACWRDTPFIAGLTCRTCGVPLPGDSTAEEHCDDCLTIARPWSFGVAAMLYRDTGRKLVLALKHGDRTDLARPAARWLAVRLQGRLAPDTLILPVPAHWRRRIARRYNQAALIARALGRETGAEVDPLALIRPRATPIQDGLSRDARFANLAGSMRLRPDRAPRLNGRPILLVDDVMTSGATLAAAAEVCLASGSGPVAIAVMARVAKDD
ncbi:ComF family protein [Anianabacter salinae]|uniref:ComF family protein n=1 Tax=Anianabacter salinae TaxID=2851023 RepID=UPI00225DE356|nr:ComF family protein [Anianabacter salinae]MBV0913550.1 ComF family protein [Anianabacter salinae]